MKSLYLLFLVIPLQFLELQAPNAPLEDLLVRANYVALENLKYTVHIVVKDLVTFLVSFHRLSLKENFMSFQSFLMKAKRNQGINMFGKIYLETILMHLRMV